MWTAMRNGVSYRRGLNGRTVAKWVEPGDIRQRRWLSSTQTVELTEAARHIAMELLTAYRSSALQLSEPFSQQALQNFQHAANFSPDRYADDEKTYHQVYKPVGILPLDQTWP
jgi:hypothetical protein